MQSTRLPWGLSIYLNFFSKERERDPTIHYYIIYYITEEGKVYAETTHTIMLFGVWLPIHYLPCQLECYHECYAFGACNWPTSQLTTGKGTIPAIVSGMHAYIHSPCIEWGNTSNGFFVSPFTDVVGIASRHTYTHQSYDMRVFRDYMKGQGTSL